MILRCLGYILFIFLESQCFVNGKSSFIASFQTEIDGSTVATTDSWIRFSDPIPSVKELTTCHWLKIKFYNINIAACLWSYCIIENADDELKCIQVCLYGVHNTANRNLLMEGWLYLQNYQEGKSVTKNLNSYMHRTWVHLCWSFSAISGISRLYHNGDLLHMEKLNVTDNDWAIKGSNKIYDSDLIFGQEPDIMRGGFDKYQAYIGDLAEFNIWNYTLSESEIREMASCNKLVKGNIVAWEQSDWITNNVLITDLPEKVNLCSNYQKYVIFPERVRYLEAKEICEIHGGILVVPKSDKESRIILDIALTHKDVCINNQVAERFDVVWIGATKINYVWYEISTAGYSKTPLNYTKILQAQATSHAECGWLRNDGGWMDGVYSCTLVSLCTICEMRKQSIFTLKGTCDISEIDWNYYPYIDSRNEIKLYEGYRTTNLVYDEGSQSWNISTKLGVPSSFIANFLPNKFTTKYPIGRKTWSMKDSVCQIEDPLYAITLSVCNFPLEFTCDSGQCININKRCDENKDCFDGSDENLCHLISIPPHYNKANAPLSAIKDAPLEITIQTNISTIDSIDTMNMMVTVTVEILLQWFDKRLSFSNLNINNDNLIPYEESTQLWTPLRDLIHGNAIIGEIIYDKNYEVRVVPSIPQNVEASKAIENIIFNGSYNFLEWTQRMKITHHCTFKVKSFPFDAQHCYLPMKIKQRKNKPITFVNYTYVFYNNAPIIGQFSIGKMLATIDNTNQSTKYTVIIPMTRIFTNQLLTTFIPTFILWLFGYATLFIVPDEDGFANRFMGAGTALLVIVTLLNAINADLPKTSYMKYIDLWFVWHVVSIFGMIVYHIILDRIRTHNESQTDDSVVPFKTVDDTALLDRNGWNRINRINDILIIVFPTINGVFYAIYFYLTLT